jgi:nucleotide-binding universal stress UspA family protein
MQFNPVTEFQAYPAVSAGIHHVLICLDRSPAAEAALPLAVHLAQQHGASMTLLHVLESPRGGTGVATDPIEWEAVRQEARAYLDDLARRIGKRGIIVDPYVAEGSAGLVVSAVAARLQIDLLVLSASGQRGRGGAGMGSTAREILEFVRQRVLIVPPGARNTASHLPPRRILVPLDGSIRAECVLPTALHLARAEDAEIVVGHVVSDPVRTELLSAPEDLALVRAVADRMAIRAEEYLERIRTQLTSGGVRASVATRRDIDHRHGLVALAGAERADLIVISAHGSICNPRSHFGSVTSYLLDHAAVPVLMIQDIRDHMSGALPRQSSRLPPRSVDVDTRAG